MAVFIIDEHRIFVNFILFVFQIQIM